MDVMEKAPFCYYQTKNEMRLFVFLQRCIHRQFFFVAVGALIIYAVS